MYRPEVVHFHNPYPLLSPASLRIVSSRRPAIVTEPAQLFNYGPVSVLAVGPNSAV
jgi:hypothetical protein